MLFESREYCVLCFADIYDVAFGACDGVDDVFVLDGDFLRNGAGGGGVLVPDDHHPAVYLRPFLFISLISTTISLYQYNIYHHISLSVYLPPYLFISIISTTISLSV